MKSTLYMTLKKVGKNEHISRGWPKENLGYSGGMAFWGGRPPDETMGQNNIKNEFSTIKLVTVQNFSQIGQL